MSKTILILMVAFPKAAFFLSCKRSALIQVNIHQLCLTTSFSYLISFSNHSILLPSLQEWDQSIKSNSITQIACNHEKMALSLWSIGGWWPDVYLTMTVMISCATIMSRVVIGWILPATSIRLVFFIERVDIPVLWMCKSQITAECWMAMQGIKTDLYISSKL